MTKYVYCFGNGTADGDASMKNLLGGKGANLAEMARLDFPVPSGFTITTECCNDYLKSGGVYPLTLLEEIDTGMQMIENSMDMKFGDPENPLLVSCRSGARQSMPGMMETVLNVGLTSKTIPGLIKQTGNERFVYDSYRRLIMMYADVVMEKAEDIKPEEDKGIRFLLEQIMNSLKDEKGYFFDTDITADELKQLCEDFKIKVREVLGADFPDDHMKQLLGATGAVFKSWNGKRAISYRRIEGLPDFWGTAVNIQSMVFGNMGNDCATGVAFSRNPATGENKFYGEWLPNAQGEDVVAGIRTPNPLNEATKNAQNEHLSSLEETMPEVYKQLVDFRTNLENHYCDMQDIEFTIQGGKLYMLQCRSGKRTGTAALNMALDMLQEGLIDEKTAVMRVQPEQLDELLHPVINLDAIDTVKEIAKGLPAGPGAASGQIVFTSEDAVKWEEDGKKVILVRDETNPEDIEGMRAAIGILTARGGMTSHAALVARGWGKCCIVGAGTIKIIPETRELDIDGIIYKEGDTFTLNGSKGIVYEGEIPMEDATENPRFRDFMAIVDKFRTMGVRANVDTPEDAKQAIEFGAEGIGLFRTEHMFYGADSDKQLFLLRKMIMSNTLKERRKALDELFPFVKKDIGETLEVMNNMPVTLRLLDPPLHEFVPHNIENQIELAKALGIDVKDVKKRGKVLLESNPMMGHRGVRLGITYPEITEMQIRSILEAAAELIIDGKQPKPEIMVPVTCDANEIIFVKEIVDKVYSEVLRKFKLDNLDFAYGTMIEIPRTALLADRMAKVCDFFSFGTNDLTQMTYGFSRDDIGGFMSEYLDNSILTEDPFQTIDIDGVGQLITITVEKGRKVKEDLKIGICGEQGGDPASVEFCYKNGLNYVSCSPFRIPIARLSAAQAVINNSVKE
ncbi:MAG: pyruvate, phosphate dikinase [Desulfobacteraceae bacterium 4572_19]|nr:MAG: pyruvate, phosphate dikinase [Desulfobacteraceae bacterium 4572_19]